MRKWFSEWKKLCARQNAWAPSPLAEWAQQDVHQAERITGANLDPPTVFAHWRPSHCSSSGLGGLSTLENIDQDGKRKVPPVKNRSILVVACQTDTKEKMKSRFNWSLQS
ncbi:hypothetical protein R1sor_010987 [Riccia sorocarpa]|uniref:Transposase n=1 Tax=Riccia sorocarpa TaxID=122646 RepID=A0ABD3I379_9MARC